MRLSHLVLCLLLFVSALAVMAAEAPVAPAKPTYEPPTRDEAVAVQKQGRYLATITMEQNRRIELVLEGSYMPLTVANFIKLTSAKYYDGLAFFRLYKPYFVQGGDQNGDGTGTPGYTINLEISPFLSHKKGAISLAHAFNKNINTNYPNSGGSQFFILQKDAVGFDGQYAVFGWVKSGMDVVEKIREKDVMLSVTVAPYFGDDKCPILAEGTTRDKAPDGKK